MGFFFNEGMDKKARHYSSFAFLFCPLSILKAGIISK